MVQESLSKQKEVNCLKLNCSYCREARCAIGSVSYTCQPWKKPFSYLLRMRLASKLPLRTSSRAQHLERGDKDDEISHDAFFSDLSLNFRGGYKQCFPFERVHSIHSRLDIFRLLIFDQISDHGHALALHSHLSMVIIRIKDSTSCDCTWGILYSVSSLIIVCFACDATIAHSLASAFCQCD
ncbi:unnamed protein product [Sphenostylis stenocarpa]|uniref:Uncharacterized protein n=1 Tax=Sphenostylis stenocarpa TaxID=92480 RepID=A0AA86VSV7_9FABA|nr:unnamed protein product [Sphenostylis stenocarpa]